MDRVVRHKDFLTRVSVSSAVQRKQIIRNASSDELKALFELFENLRSIDVTVSEKKSFKKFLKSLKKFYKDKWTLKSFKSFLLKNPTLLPVIIFTILSKVVNV